MSRKPESRLTKKTLDKLRSEVGGFWFKVHGGPFQAAGIPDILGCVCGFFVAIEMKMPRRKNRVSERQKYVIELIQKAGGIVGVATTPEEALEIVTTGLEDKVVSISRSRRQIRKKALRLRALHGARNRQDVNRSVRGRSSVSSRRSGTRPRRMSKSRD